MQISRLKKLVFVLLMITCLTVTYMPSFSFAADNVPPATADTAVEEQTENTDEEQPPAADTEGEVSPEDGNTVPGDQAVNNTEGESGEETAVENQDGTQQTDAAEPEEEKGSDKPDDKDKKDSEPDGFDLMLDDGQTVTYKSARKGSGSGETTVFTVKDDGKTYKGVCAEQGVPGGSGRAKLSRISNGKKIAKVVYKYGVKQKWLTGDDATDNCTNLLKLSYHTDVTKRRMLECFCQIANMGENAWLKAVTGSQGGWSSSTAKAVLKYYKNIDTSDINVPSNFNLYLAKPTSSGVQDFMIWEMEDDPLYLKLFKVDANSGEEIPLEGAVYWLYEDDTCKNRAEDVNGDKIVLTTKANGYSNTVKLEDTGTYYAKEKTAPEGYAVDGNALPVKVKKANNTSANAAVLKAQDFTENQLFIRIHKQAKKDGVYLFLEGAVYNVYLDEACTIPAYGKNDTENPIVLTTDADGYSNIVAVPDLGQNETSRTYYAKEVQAPDGYEKDDTVLQITVGADNTANNPATFESLEETTGEQRGDVRFRKSDENGNKLVNIPFVITNLDTGEVHYVITDSNGVVDTSYVPHSHHTDFYDATLQTYNLKTQIADSVLTGLADEHNYDVGTWFYLTPGSSTEDEVDDEKGALPLGSYRVDEMLCDQNENRILKHETFEITVPNETVDLGTFIDWPRQIRTQAQDFDSNNHTGTVADNAKIEDTVEYWGLETDKQYRLKAELHWSAGLEGSKLDGGQVYDANGNAITGDSGVFQPTTQEGTKKVTLGEFDSQKLTVDGEELEGEDTVVFEYLYLVEEDGTETLINEHADPDDTDQIISYPWIKTLLTDDDTGIRMGFARDAMKLTDTITYKNFRRNQEYHVQGGLYDADTGLAIKDASGHAITTDEWYTATQTSGTFKIHYEFDSRDLEGHSVVSYVTLAASGASTINHKVQTDEEETVHIPKIRTKAADKETVDEVGKVVGTFTDTVTYENLLPGLTYTMSMELMDKETGESTGIKASKEFTTDSDGTRSDGEVVVEYDLSQKYTKDELEAMTLVSFEECLVKAGQVTVDGTNQPQSDEKVAEHKDMADDNQTVHYPKIRTTARDGKTDDHVGTVTGENTSIDSVECWNLVPGKEYTISGTYYDTEDNAVLATASSTFTAENAHEIHEIIFELNTSALEGRTAVIYEKLYHNNVEVTQHEEKEEEQQRVHYPKIRTTATDSLTGDHVGTILGKLINKFRRAVGQDVPDEDFAGIIDTVRFQNLLADQEYTIKGTLRYKEDFVDADGKEHKAGDAVTDENGNEVTAERVLEAGKHQADGEVNLYFTVDTSKLQNVTVVAFEKLYHKNAVTEAAIEVTRHEDLTDEEQSIHEVELRTHAGDLHIASDGIALELGESGNITGPENYKGPHYDWHTGDATGMTTIRDDVSLKNLVNGMTYTITGTLHDKATGDLIEGPNGMPYTVRKTIEVNDASGQTRVDMVVPLEFQVDGKFLEGRTVVAFEELYHNDILISVHADTNDEDQSVYYPWIRTLAQDKNNNAKETQISTKTEIKDTVSYKNLLPGKYMLEGVLTDSTSSDGLLRDASGNLVKQTDTFTITTKDEGREGTRELVFTFDSTLLKDHITVVYERLYLLDANDPAYKVPVAKHEDPTDESQAEWIIDIKTNLTDTMDDSDEGEERRAAVFNDHVEYWGLVPGKEYTMRGVLMDKATGAEFVDADGKTVTAETKFVPEKSCGFVDLKFEANTEGLAGKTVVAFERLYPSDVPDAVIARHEDITDPEQSVNIIKIETEMEDRDTGMRIALAGKDLYTDHVSYTNLTVGRTYILVATLMDKATGKVVKNEYGDPVRGTTTFVPETKDGVAEVDFDIDASKLAGKTLVSFERLYAASAHDVTIATHEDLTDEGQSIHVPKISTKADYKKKVVYDTVKYTNLLKGQKYLVKGYLVDTKTGKRIRGSAGERYFKAKKSDGSIEVELPVKDMKKLYGSKVTAFEELYIVTDTDDESVDEEVLVAEHKDLTDKKQTVRVRDYKHPGKKGHTPKTGDTRMLYVFSIMLALALAEVLILRKKKTLKK